MTLKYSKPKSKIFWITLINFYQKNISPFSNGKCVFYPSCSEYFKESILKYGGFKGIYLGSRRILRCHPWQKNNLDPVP